MKQALIPSSQGVATRATRTGIVAGFAIALGATVAPAQPAPAQAQPAPAQPAPAEPPAQPAPAQPAPAQPPATDPPAAQPPPAEPPPPPAEPPTAQPPAPAEEPLGEPQLPPPPPEPEIVPPAPPEPKTAPGAAAAGATADTTAAEEPVELTEDELEVPNYTPGYRRHMGLGVPAHMPRVDSLAGGVTPAYGVPITSKDWTFKFSGYMNASLQFSVDSRARPAPGQSSRVYHTPPQTIDEWSHFTSTSSVPGNWVNMNFSYGNRYAQALVSIDTWQPSRPTTYYQIGAQYFINNAFITLRPDAVGGLRMRFTLGHFGNSYGTLGQYGNGIYTNPIAGSTRGVGETTFLEHDINDDWIAVFEHGFMGGDRTGKYPDDVVAQSSNSWKNPAFPASWIHHAHLGAVLKGDPEISIQTHYITNWSQDDRTARELDNPDSRQLDESRPEDGRMTVYSVSATLQDSVYGFLGVAGAIVDAHDAYTIKGLTTYGGTGEEITDRYFGTNTGGTGELYVAGINYAVSLGKIVAYPTPFPGDGPDIQLNTGYHIATTKTEFEGWDGRVRQRYGVDGMYTLLSWFGVGVRVDRVIPNSKNPEETFHVLAPRLQFKTDWTSREALSLRYVKWFYGPESRNEGTGLRTPDRLDDQLFALNFNMWW